MKWMYFLFCLMAFPLAWINQKHEYDWLMIIYAVLFLIATFILTAYSTFKKEK